MWKCVCTAGLARRQRHTREQNTGASRGHRLGSARLAWAWLEARVQHSLTLLAQPRQLDTLTRRGLGGGNESPIPSLWVGLGES